MFMCESAKFPMLVLHEVKIAISVVRWFCAGSHPSFSENDCPREQFLFVTHLSLFFDPLTCKNAVLNAYIRNLNGQKTVISWKRSRKRPW